MKKIVIALLSLAVVFIVSVTITDEARNEVAGIEKSIETHLPGRANESPYL